MNLRAFVIASVAAVGFAFASAPVQADAWDTAKAAAETYLETKYASTGVDQVTLTKSEFGNTSNKAAGHVVVDVLFDGVLGGQLTYVPARGAFTNFANFGGDGDDHNPGVIPNKYCASLEASAPQRRQGGFCDYATSNATLAPKSGGMSVTGITAAVARSCTWQANFRDEHSC